MVLLKFIIFYLNKGKKQAAVNGGAGIARALGREQVRMPAFRLEFVSPLGMGDAAFLHADYVGIRLLQPFQQAFGDR